MQDSVQACIKRYPRIWKHVHVLNLTRNMRVERLTGSEGTIQRDFASWLLRVGDGTEKVYPAISPNAIRLPDAIVASVPTAQFLIDTIYGEPRRFADAHYLVERAILTPRNEDVNDINDRVRKLFTGPERAYVSVDSVEPGAHAAEITAYPPEVLATLDPACIPPARLLLKVGMPVILLRNMNGDQGQARSYM